MDTGNYETELFIVFKNVLLFIATLCATPKPYYRYGSDILNFLFFMIASSPISDFHSSIPPLHWLLESGSIGHNCHSHHSRCEYHNWHLEMLTWTKMSVFLTFFNHVADFSFRAIEKVQFYPYLWQFYPQKAFLCLSILPNSLQNYTFHSIPLKKKMIFAQV